MRDESRTGTDLADRKASLEPQDCSFCSFYREQMRRFVWVAVSGLGATQHLGGKPWGRLWMIGR